MPSISNSAPAPLKINESVLLLILAAVNFTHIMDFVVMAPLSPILRDELHISTRQFGFLLSSYTLSAAAAGVIGSFFIDKFDRRNSLLFLYVGFTISNFACAVSNDYYSFMAARILAGGFGGVLGSVPYAVILSFSTLFFIFFGARFVPAMSMMTSSVEMRQRGSFMSINSSVQQIGSSIAVALAGFVVHNAADGSLINFDWCGLIAIAATIGCIFVSFKVNQVS